MQQSSFHVHQGCDDLCSVQSQACSVVYLNMDEIKVFHEYLQHILMVLDLIYNGVNYLLAYTAQKVIAPFIQT